MRKNVISVVAGCLAVVLSFMSSTSILASETDKVIYQDGNIITYEDVVTNEKYVEVNFDDYKDEESVVLYFNEETGEKVIVDIGKNNVNDGISLLEYNGGSWSAGTIPNGTYSLYPHIENPRYTSGEIGFWLDVSAYPVVFTNAYNPVVRALFISISDVETSIIRDRATSSAAAKATMNWIASGNVSGIQVGTTVCYMSAEINSKGNLRISWNY